MSRRPLSKNLGPCNFRKSKPKIEFDRKTGTQERTDFMEAMYIAFTLKSTKNIDRKLYIKIIPIPLLYLEITLRNCVCTVLDLIEIKKLSWEFSVVNNNWRAITIHSYNKLKKLLLLKFIDVIYYTKVSLFIGTSK